MSVKNEAVATKVVDASSLTHFEDERYQVVHSCKGHLRIRIPRLADDTTYANRLKFLVESLDFVTSIRLNSAASSLVVEYDFNALVMPDTVQKQIFTAIEQATATEDSQLQSNLLPPRTVVDLAETDLSHSDGMEVAEDNSASSTESQSLPASNEKTSRGYALLVRGNYSVSAYLKSG